ncbi:TetR/AcrR family transcriptional regulator [Flavobacterium litorale]|uniref:TetR/AcrR family transcriptional regulator n=1 Tax=Flavobacterium litorale TaxID=2856519 RepID=A0ABX8VF73_9FLAO|nr:TetR/AcrR family transcriptional regulator [Flavobacterium litorale]QYJ69264.1 TetR/AcrR family transcriptional regulator [Flavobacterium litorale]
MSDKKDIDTEQLIKNTAKRMFFGEGLYNATTQEIADKAGVNRTLINYYFRSRDNLFQIIFDEAREEEVAFTDNIMSLDIPFKEKISGYLDMYFEQSEKYPYLEIYMVTQMNQNCHYSKDPEVMERVLDKFYLEIALEMEKGNIMKMRPEQFLLNMISLTCFPISMRPLIEQSLGCTTAQYSALLAERKEIIMNTLFKQ